MYTRKAKNSCKILNNNFRLKTLNQNECQITEEIEQYISRYRQYPLKTVQRETRGSLDNTKLQCQYQIMAQDPTRIAKQ